MRKSEKLKYGLRVVLPVETSSFEEAFRRGVLRAMRQQGTARLFLGERAALLGETRAAGAPELAQLGFLCSAREIPLVNEAGEKGVPCVAWGEGAVENWKLDGTRPLSLCVVDNAAIGRMAAAHFLRRGVFRSFAYADSPAESARDWWARTRGRGFEEAIAFARRVTVSHLSVPELPRPSSITVLVERLRTLPAPVAVFACSDRVARSLINLCQEYAIRVPTDVAVLGVMNDSALCTGFRVGLSSVRVDLEQMGAEAFRMLMDLRQSGRGKRTILPPVEVVERDSTCVRPTTNLHVNAARDFIATAPLPELTVDAVIRKSGTSKTYLTYWFRELTGRTILETIHDRFLNEVRDRVLKTEMSVNELAAFYNIRPSTLCSLFKQAFGLPILQFRRRHGVKTYPKGEIAASTGI